MTQWIIPDPDFYDLGPGREGKGPKVSGYRTKDTYAGDTLRVEGFAYWDTRPRCGARAKKLKESRAAQKRLNAKNAAVRFVDLLNANFNARDLHIVGTYDDKHGQLPDIDRVRKDVRNYLASIQRALARLGLPKAKYMYVIEGAAPGSKQKRIHVHLVIGCGLSREELENLWRHGRAHADRLQPDEYGLIALGRYLSKDPKGRKRWSASKGLKQPEVRISDRKLSRRRAAEIARDRYAAKAIAEKLYPGWTIKDPEQDVTVRTSEHVSGAYISMRLVRADDKTKNMRRRK